MEYAQQNNLNEYAEFIEKLAIDYILNCPKLRKQMALNSFNFSDVNIVSCWIQSKIWIFALKKFIHRQDNEDLLSYAQRNEMRELCCFLENVDLYQVGPYYLATLVWVEFKFN